jgi:hypothetical protein
MFNNNLITNNNNNIFDDSNIKKIKVNINNNLNKSKNKYNKKKNSLNKTISITNNINENRNDNIQRIFNINNNNINNRYNLNLRQLQNYNSKRDIFQGDYTNLIRITPRINKCNTPNHNKIYNTKADLQKSIDCNTLSQLDNQNNDIEMNISTEKNKNVYQILYNNEIGQNFIYINRNNEWSNLYYSIDSNNLRKSGKNFDLTLNKNENQTKTNDFLTKEKIEDNESKNEASIDDYSFVKKKNCLDIDYIYKNKYGIKLSKNNGNIYPSNSNTRNNSKHNDKILTNEDLMKIDAIIILKSL